MTSPRKSRPFEKMLGELETIVERLENGELSLDESLKTFEAGIRLTQECQETLTRARQRVQLLVARDDGLQAESLSDTDDGDDEPDDAATDDDD